jgi:hypothetical protein
VKANLVHFQKWGSIPFKVGSFVMYTRGSQPTSALLHYLQLLPLHKNVYFSRFYKFMEWKRLTVDLQWMISSMQWRRLFCGLLGLANAVTSRQVHCHGIHATALHYGNQTFLKQPKSFPKTDWKFEKEYLVFSSTNCVMIVTTDK